MSNTLYKIMDWKYERMNPGDSIIDLENKKWIKPVQDYHISVDQTLFCVNNGEFSHYSRVFGNCDYNIIIK